jgi:hypothetical protein
MKKFKTYLWYITLPVTTVIVVLVNLIAWIPACWIATTEVINVIFRRYEWWTCNRPREEHLYSSPWHKTLSEVWIDAINHLADHIM